MAKRLLWTSDFDVEDFDLDPEFYGKDPADWTEAEIWKYCCVLNDEYLYDERANLRECRAPYGILAIIDQGLWDGRRTVYRIIPQGDTSAATCLAWIEGEYYCDNYNLRATVYHHDGRNHITYRAIKFGEGYKLQNKIWDCQAAGKTLSKRDIARYTYSLRPMIAEVYGWKTAKTGEKKSKTGKKTAAA